MSFGLMVLAAATLAAGPAGGASLPDELRGRWSPGGLECPREDTRGMRVSNDSVIFYETKGSPKTVRTERSGTIVAEMSYQGEGRN